MVAESQYSWVGERSYLQDILDAPEHPNLRRLTTLVEHLFQVRVAYMALFGNTCSVVARIGSGTEYAPILQELQGGRSIEEPLLVCDSQRDLPSGTDCGDIRFAASAPLRTSSGVCLGALIIADREPRPHFSKRDARTLGDLASVLAGKMELRLIASLALESELSLRETERRFRGIANCAPLPLIYSDSDGHCRFVNRTWLDFSGRSLEEELDGGWSDLIREDYRERVVGEYSRAFENRQPFSTEMPLRRQDGQYRWMLGQGAPRFREDRSFAGYVGCLLDITDHRDALRRQSQLTVAVADAARACYLIVDPDGRIVEVSSQFRKVSQRKPQEIVGALLWEVCEGVIQEAPGLHEAHRQAIAGRTVTQTRTSAREGPDLSWTLTPIDSERGELSAVVAIAIEARGQVRETS